MEVTNRRIVKHPPNQAALAAMSPKDVMEVREIWIAKLVEADRKNLSDEIKECLEWIIALTCEMRVRGGVAPHPKEQPLIVPGR